MNKEKIFEMKVSKDKPMDWEERPLEVREVEEKAYMILGEYAWILREENSKFFIEMRNLNDLDKTLMFKIRTTEESDYMVIDVLSCDFEEIEKYKMMFWTERNRDLFFRKFKDKDYKWVIKDLIES